MNRSAIEATEDRMTKIREKPYTEKAQYNVLRQPDITEGQSRLWEMNNHVVIDRAVQ